MLKRKISTAAALSLNNEPKTPKISDHNDDTKSLESCEANNISKYFSESSHCTFAQKFINIQLELNSQLKSLQFQPPVAFTYNPVEYAFKANEAYVRKYCTAPKHLLFMGMNPGPFGMCQTGVPFGEIKSVRDWLQIEENVSRPDPECPKRPVLGFACTRTEVSGDRFWNLFKKVCTLPENFFSRSFVYNYCPLTFMKTDGCNVSPREMKGEDCKRLEEVCDVYCYKIIELLQPAIVIGIGEYAEKRVRFVLKKYNIDNISVLRIPHPSPRAVNNQNWLEKAEKFLRENNLMQFLNSNQA